MKDFFVLVWWNQPPHLAHRKSGVRREEIELAKELRCQGVDISGWVEMQCQVNWQAFLVLSKERITPEEASERVRACMQADPTVGKDPNMWPDEQRL